MFAEKFDALMNISEVSNSLLGRNVNMNSSHIGRLRSGARALPKKHDYLTNICRYLAKHIEKYYQIIALQKLTGIGKAALSSPEAMTSYLEHWLLHNEHDTAIATGRLISGFSHIISHPASLPEVKEIPETHKKYSPYLYGNAGKRKAVEQFFMMILKEEKPQKLLLFSDENMSWLYEDAPFVAKWTELFTQILLKGNRVHIIHTISRDMNEMLEAVTKWIPIYMSGMIEPYCYPRLRDGVFQRTLFIAPNTAAIVSSSVQQDTDNMLNLFITDRFAIDALVLEYNNYFSLCRPLMNIFKSNNIDEFKQTADRLWLAKGAACLCTAMPPLFSMPRKLVNTLAQQSGNEKLQLLWNKSLASFRRLIKEQSLSLVLLNPTIVKTKDIVLYPSTTDIFEFDNLSYSKEQYWEHIEHLKQLEKYYKNLTVTFRNDISKDMLLYAKDEIGVIMAKADKPTTAFVINERNMVNAFWDYLINS